MFGEERTIITVGRNIQDITVGRNIQENKIGTGDSTAVTRPVKRAKQQDLLESDIESEPLPVVSLDLDSSISLIEINSL